MSGAVASPVAEDLTVAPLRAKVKITGVTPDADLFYYRARQLVEITGDEEVGIATNAQAAIGILEDSLTTKTNPNGLDARARISVIPFGFRRVLYMTAEGALTAGQKVTQGSTSKQAVKAASNLGATSTPTKALTAAVPAGETAVLSSSAQPTLDVAGTLTVATTLAGGIPPETIIGVVWKGAANGGIAKILAY